MTGPLPTVFGKILALAPAAALATAVALALLTGDASARPPYCDPRDLCW